MNIILSGRGELYDPAVEEPRRAGFRAILERGQREGAFRAFDVGVMAGTDRRRAQPRAAATCRRAGTGLEAYGREAGRAVRPGDAAGRDLKAAAAAQ
ncbi:MAG: hypothetical protein WDN69_18365 [Aliidongia sp.]